MAMMVTPGAVATTDSVILENIYKLNQEPYEAARQIDKLDLTVRSVAANRHEVAGETFPTVELAGEHVRKLLAIARKIKAQEAKNEGAQ